MRRITPPNISNYKMNWKRKVGKSAKISRNRIKKRKNQRFESDYKTAGKSKNLISWSYKIYAPAIDICAIKIEPVRTLPR